MENLVPSRNTSSSAASERRKQWTMRESAERTASTSRLFECVVTWVQSEPPLLFLVRAFSASFSTSLTFPFPLRALLVLGLRFIAHSGSLSSSLSESESYAKMLTGPVQTPL